jgi:hypothetical protein
MLSCLAMFPDFHRDLIRELAVNQVQRNLILSGGFDGNVFVTDIEKLLTDMRRNERRSENSLYACRFASFRCSLWYAASNSPAAETLLAAFAGCQRAQFWRAVPPTLACSICLTSAPDLRRSRSPRTITLARSLWCSTLARPNCSATRTCHRRMALAMSGEPVTHAFQASASGLWGRDRAAPGPSLSRHVCARKPAALLCTSDQPLIGRHPFGTRGCSLLGTSRPLAMANCSR